MYKDVQVQCVSLLPINCLLKVAPPFSINKERLNMETGDTDVLRIEFDPGHKYDKISG